MNYGRDYYRFKKSLLYVALPGFLLMLAYLILSSLNIIKDNFFDELPSWALWLIFGIIGFGYLCWFLFNLAEIDESINE